MNISTNPLSLDQATSPACLNDEARVRQFIKQQYSETFDASIDVTFPHLLSFQDEHRRILSAIGYRDGSDALFVEHYTDQPVEMTLANIYECTVERQYIVELGNLASRSTRHTILLLQKTWLTLQRLGFRYVVFAGTRSVVQLFKSLPYSIIAEANALAVPDAEQWGSYYTNQPVVLCARLEDYDQRFGLGTHGRDLQLRHFRHAERVA